MVSRQAAAGIDIVNDGEYGKSSWANYVLERMSGFELRPGGKSPRDWLGRDKDRFKEVVDLELKDSPGPLMQHVCTRAIRYRPGDVQRDIDNLKAALAGANAAEGFLTVVAPGSAVFNGVNERYGSEREYIFALAEALREEYLAMTTPTSLQQATRRLQAARWATPETRSATNQPHETRPRRPGGASMRPGR